MPTFQFEALDQTGRPQKGTIDAPNSEDAISKIKGQGFFPTSVREKKTKGGGKAAKGGAKDGAKKGGGLSITFGPFGKVPTKLLCLFTRQLSTLQDAGLPVLRSLQILAEQQKPGVFRNTLIDVQEEVEGGSSLSDAMAKHPKVFNRLYTKMIAAGEIGGVLDVILQRLAEFMEKAERLKKKIIGAMIYPSVVVGVACFILLGIMVFVVPQFEEIFRDFDTAMPAPTLFLIWFSNWIVGAVDGQTIPGYAILFGFPFAVFLINKILQSSNTGRNISDTVKLIPPVFGTLLRYTAIARFTRTLGTLVNAGVPILEAITITSDTVGNYVYERALKKVHDSIREGNSFAEPLREAKVCDNLVVNMIDVGEETGDLDKMLMKIADNYDEQVDIAVEAMVSVMEPMMVVFLGGAVGFIVIALFLPLVSIIQSLSS